MHLEARGTFQIFTHNDKSYVVMNVEATRLYIVSHAEASESQTCFTPLGEFSSMAKVRSAITAHAENRR